VTGLECNFSRINTDRQAAQFVSVLAILHSSTLVNVATIVR